MKLMLFVFSFAIAVLVPETGSAKEFPVQARLFAGNSQADPKDLNDELTAQSLDKMEKILFYGVEATYVAARFLNVGFRYTKRLVDVDEVGSGLNTDYSARLDQDSVMAIARLPVIRTKFFFIDAFGGYGGTNTTFKIKTASQDGELSKREANDWFARPVLAYGGSFGIGYDKFFIAGEVGMENNKVDGFKRTGTVNNNVEEIDLSGSYFMISLIFNGVPASKK